MSRDTSDGISTHYGPWGLGIEFRWRRDFPHTYRPAPGHTQPPLQLAPGLNGRGVALTTHPHLALRLQKEWSCTSTPLCAFMAGHRAKFTKLLDNGPRGDETCWRLIIENFGDITIQNMSRSLTSVEKTTRTHTRNKNSQTPKKLRKNTRKPLPQNQMHQAYAHAHIAKPWRQTNHPPRTRSSEE